MIAQLSFHTPVGEVTLTEEDGALISLDWGRGPPDFQKSTPGLTEARRQMDAYFDGSTAPFDLPFRPAGTPYHQQVWLALSAIPHGRTVTYGELAAQTGSAARAIGVACGANPLPILIPCHRVLAANGRMGGYSGSGGTTTKLALLRLEGALRGPLL